MELTAAAKTAVEHVYHVIYKFSISMIFHALWSMLHVCKQAHAQGLLVMSMLHVSPCFVTYILAE